MALLQTENSEEDSEDGETVPSEDTMRIHNGPDKNPYEVAKETVKAIRDR